MTSPLEGNGAPLVRERAMAASVQRLLERAYRLDRVADVEAFVLPAEEGERETLLVREAADGTLEMGLRLPPVEPREFDVVCQVIEGVSHFVYLAHRASADRATTALEMELQAEVDKYVVLAAQLEELDEPKSRKLRERLYEQVRFVHDEGSDLGQRYRVANRAAHRFVRELERRFVRTRRWPEMRTALSGFFHMGQMDKMWCAG